MIKNMALLSEPTRFKILELIWDIEHAAADIAAQFNVTFGAISQHLKTLREANIVIVRKAGRHRYYRASKETLGTLAPVLESMWCERLSTLKALAESEAVSNVNPLHCTPPIDAED